MAIILHIITKVEKGYYSLKFKNPSSNLSEVSPLTERPSRRIVRWRYPVWRKRYLAKGRMSFFVFNNLPVVILRET